MPSKRYCPFKETDMKRSPDIVVKLKPVLLTLEQVVEYTTLSSATINRKVLEGTFPKARALSAHRAGWVVSEIDAWVEALPKADFLPPENTSHKRKRSERVG
jgi:prophage regulatory protein